VIVGVVFTVIVLTAVLAPMQPNTLVPVTEYDAVVNGLTTFEPDEYVYVVAPDGVIVKLLPVQITPEFTVMVGVVFTVIVLTAVLDPTHPNALVPVTV
jgi:hypothetical protein